MLGVRSALFVAALAGVALAGVDDVLILGKANFTETVGGDDLVMVKFYAPWCGHCKSMKKDYEDAAEELKGEAVLAEVDATIEKEIASEYGVQGFPTLKVFQAGQVISDYSGARDKVSLVEFMKTSKLPPVQDLDADALKEAMEDEKALFVFIQTEDEASKAEVDEKFKKFEGHARKVKSDLSGKALFAAVPESIAAPLIEKSAAKAGDVVAKSAGGADSAVFSTVDATKEDFGDYAMISSVPVFGELSRESASMYISHPCVVLFAEPGNEKHEEYKTVMAEAAKKLIGNGKVLFAWIDSKVLGKFQEQLGLTSDPAMAIVEFEGLTKYIYEEEFTAEKIVPWVQSYVDGTLTPNLKSQPEPESNEEPVKVIVGDTWEKIVMDPTKDVLVEQYAPWCGHCKKLEPIYNELATKLAGVESIVIAKMDATENDAPPNYSAKGYPTIQFFPAGENKEMIAYNGARKLDGFVSFLKEKAAIKFEMPAEDAADAGEEAHEEL